MWNEPNGTGFWMPKPSPKEYCSLLVAGAEAAKTADPKCWIVGCNTAHVDLPFIRGVFEEGGYEYSDIISVHPYPYPHTPETTDLLDDLSKLAALCAEFGGVKPVWITEVGYATHRRTRRIGGVVVRRNADADLSVGVGKWDSAKTFLVRLSRRR
ncbi:MAG: hypothetical protein QGH20_03320 [Candidatus Latescibacteria bacterium]|jgi:hypothetical protein|nr:hypothetical protein [Candidatus Latescibacterota bacterium]